MAPHFKALWLALIALAAMSAIAAQGASAAVDHSFNAESTPVTLTADDEETIHKLQANEAVVECTESSFAGTQAESPKDTVRLKPTYKGCKIGPVEVTVTNNGCDYVFDSDTTTDPNTGGETAPVSIDCGMTGSITIAGPSCLIHFFDTNLKGEPVNQNLHGVKYTNKNEGKGKERDVTVEAKVHGIHYEATNNGCALLGITKGTHTDGVYEGSSTVRGYKDPSEHIAANQVGVFMSTP